MTKNPDQRLICLSGGNIRDRNMVALELQKQLGEHAVIIQSVNERIIRSIDERPVQAHIGRNNATATSSDLLQFRIEAQRALDDGKTVIAVSEVLGSSTAQGDFLKLAKDKAQPLAGIILDQPGVTTLTVPAHWRAFPADTEFASLMGHISTARPPQIDKTKDKPRFYVEEARSAFGGASYMPNSHWNSPK